MQIAQELIAQIKELITNKTSPEKEDLKTKLNSFKKDDCHSASQLYTQAIDVVLDEEKKAEEKYEQEIEEIDNQAEIDAVFIRIYLRKIELYQYLELCLQHYLEKDEIDFENDDEERSEEIIDELLDTLEKQADCFFDLSELLTISNEPQLKFQLLETTLSYYISLIELIEQKQFDKSENSKKYFNKKFEINLAILMILSLFKDEKHAEQLLQSAAKILHFYNKYPQTLTALKKAEIESYRFIILDRLGKKDEAIQSCLQFITLYEYCWNNSIDIDNLREDYLKAQQFLFKVFYKQSNNIRAVTHADKYIELYDNVGEDKWADTSDDTARQQWRDYLEAHKFRCNQYISLYEQHPIDENHFKAYRACNQLYNLFDELIDEEDKSLLYESMKNATRFKSKYPWKGLTADLPKHTQEKLPKEKRKVSSQRTTTNKVKQLAKQKRQKTDEEYQDEDDNESNSDNDEVIKLRSALLREKEQRKKLQTDFAQAQSMHLTEKENHLKRIKVLEDRLSTEIKEQATTKLNYESQIKKLEGDLNRVKTNLSTIELALEERQGIIDDLRQRLQDMQEQSKEFEKLSQAWQLQRTTLTEERDTSHAQYLSEKFRLESQIAEIRQKLCAANARSAKSEAELQSFKNSNAGTKPWTPAHFQLPPSANGSTTSATPSSIQSGIISPLTNGVSQ